MRTITIDSEENDDWLKSLPAGKEDREISRRVAEAFREKGEKAKKPEPDKEPALGDAWAALTDARRRKLEKQAKAYGKVFKGKTRTMAIEKISQDSWERAESED